MREAGLWSRHTWHPDVAEEYQRLKIRLAAEHPNDRVAYTGGKTDFILKVTVQAKQAFEVAQKLDAADG